MKTSFSYMSGLTTLLTTSCYYSEAILVSYFSQEAHVRTYILGFTPRHVGWVISGTQRDRFSFTVLQHNIFPDIWRHLSQQGWTEQFNLAPRIHLNDWVTNMWSFQVFYFKQLA